MIHGLDRRIRPPRLGTIALGIKVGSGSAEHPQETSYFVVAPDGEIAKKYGEKPTTLPVRFPWNEPEQNLHDIFYVQRKGRSKVRQCDGRTFVEIQPGGKDVEGDCPKAKTPENLYAPCSFGCRATARLSVMVAGTRMGIHEIKIGGLQRIADVLASLRLFRAAIGPLSQFPFEVGRVQVEEQYFKADGSPQWRKGYPVQVRSPYTLEEVAALHEAQGVQAALPPAPHEEDVVDLEDEDGNGHGPNGRTVAPIAPVPDLPAGQNVTVAPGPRIVAQTASGLLVTADGEIRDAAPIKGLVNPTLDDQRRQIEQEEQGEWEVCCRRAIALDIDRETWEAYLAALYGSERAFLELSDLHGALDIAERNPGTRAAFKAAVRAKARQAAKA